MFAVIIVHVWRLLPLAAIILLAGMNSIPKEIVEAAKMDGAGYFRRLFEIVLPLLFPVIGITMLFGTFFTFTNMDVVWILTKGGPPPNSTQVLATLAFLDGIEGGDLAKGAAMAIFFFPVLAGMAGDRAADGEKGGGVGADAAGKQEGCADAEKIPGARRALRRR